MPLSIDVHLIVCEVEDEVHRALDLHRFRMINYHEAHSVILEELEEFWDEVKVNPRKLSESAKLARRQNIRKELRQCAAMCIRALYELKDVDGN